MWILLQQGCGFNQHNNNIGTEEEEQQREEDAEGVKSAT